MNQLKSLALGKGSFISSDLVLKSELWMREVTKRHASVRERGGW